jgi:phytoene dehydrogenase-like protein
LNTTDAHYDAIVIGSGIGGLTTAALLARLDEQSALVLEQHHTLGGFTHSFQRQGQYTWDVGVHYVGGMSPGEPSRKLMDFVSEQRLEWSPLPDPYDVFVYPDERFGVPADRSAYRNQLVDRFPGEEEAIDEYFRELDKAASWYQRHMMAEALPGMVRWPIDGYNWFTKNYANRTTRDHLEDLTDNEKLQSLLVTNWGDYGLLPAESSFAVHAVVTSSYFEGAYYPVGGSESIAESIVPTVESAGGECLVDHEVEEIVVHDGEATGVRVEDPGGTEKRYSADRVISDAGAHNTYRDLLSDRVHEGVNRIVESLDQFSDSRSFVTLYLGLEKSPESLGVQGENYWVNQSWGHSDDNLNPFQVLRGNPEFCFLSFGPENDPTAEYSTAQVITMAPYEAFEAWSDESWPRRSGDYQELKQRIGDGLMDRAEEAVPGLSRIVDFREVSTPLSIEHFTGHRRGAPYGIPAVPDRFDSPATGVDTPIDNLYLTGADAGCPGVMGAAFSGMFAAGRAMGGITGPLKVLKQLR